MTIAEQIYKLVKALPQEQANEVLTFAEFIYANIQMVINRSAQSLQFPGQNLFTPVPELGAKTFLI